MKRMPSSNDLMRCQLPARTEPNRSEVIRTGSNRPGPNKKRSDPVRRESRNYRNHLLKGNFGPIKPF